MEQVNPYVELGSKLTYVHVYLSTACQNATNPKGAFTQKFFPESWRPYNAKGRGG